jgi:hypothetical protein
MSKEDYAESRSCSDVYGQFRLRGAFFFIFVALFGVLKWEILRKFGKRRTGCGFLTRHRRLTAAL